MYKVYVDMGDGHPPAYFGEFNNEDTAEAVANAMAYGGKVIVEYTGDGDERERLLRTCWRLYPDGRDAGVPYEEWLERIRVCSETVW